MDAPRAAGLGVMAALLAAGVLAVRGCAAEPQASPGTAGEQDAAAAEADARLDGSRDGDARGDVDARTDADAAADVAPPDARKDALPDAVPAGWQEYTGWSADCPLYVPGPGAQMPPPIEWEPCPAPPVPPELGCRRMKITWDGTIGFYPNFSLDPQTGAALLQFTRTGPDYNNSVFYRLVAEADGPVRTALLQTNASWDCQFFEQSLADGRFAVSAVTRLQGSGADAGKEEEGVVAGGIDDRTPTTVLKLPADPTAHSDWRISSDWIVQTKYFPKAWTWDLSSTTTIYDPAQDPDGLPAYLPIIHHKDVFVIVGDFGLCGVMSWNPTVGLRPLLRWYGDPTRGAGNFGTDGVDMVWTYTTGAHACHTDMEDSREVWTAPYTVDPAQVQSTARRLRSDVRGLTGHSYAVGFGYAARGSDFGSPRTNSFFIVRLSDGVSWILNGDPDADTLSWGPNVLGFTHDEVFLTGSMQGEIGIFRIRLDTLGPGTPPD